MEPRTKKKLGVWLSVAGVLLVLAVYGGIYAVMFTLPMPLPMFLLLEGLVFAAGLGVSQQEALAPLTCLDMVGQSVTAADLRSYLSAILLRVLELRDREAGGQCRGPLRQALTYIDSHFTDGPLSLNQVARAVNISPNYLSAVFSQEMGETFTEYVTGRRMELAGTLLLPSGERRLPGPAGPLPGRAGAGGRGGGGGRGLLQPRPL